MQRCYVQYQPSPYLRGFALVLLAAFSYGLQPFFAHYAYASGADPTGLLLIRFSLAAAIMLLWLKKSRVILPSPPAFARTLLVGVGYACAALGYYSASHSTSVSLAIILMFSFPAFVTLYSVLMLGESCSGLKIFSLVLACGGVALAAGTEFSGDLRGVLWALFAALSYGTAILYGTHRLAPESSGASAGIILLGGALSFALAALLQGLSWPQTPFGWAAALGLALFATLLPVLSFISGAPLIGASDAATLSTLEPVVAVAIAVTLIGEELSQSMLWGGVMVVCAALLLSRNRSRRDSVSPGSTG